MERHLNMKHLLRTTIAAVLLVGFTLELRGKEKPTNFVIFLPPTSEFVSSTVAS